MTITNDPRIPYILLRITKYCHVMIPKVPQTGQLHFLIRSVSNDNNKWSWDPQYSPMDNKIVLCNDPCLHFLWMYLL